MPSVKCRVILYCSSNELIQFKYGGDGLDPMMMEGKDQPVDFTRVFHHVRAASDPLLDEDPVDAETMLQSVDELISEMIGPSEEFKSQLRAFVVEQAKKMNAIHKV